MRGGRLQEVLIIGLSAGKFWVWIGGRGSLMGGGRLREVLNIGLLVGKFWCLDRWSLTRSSYHRALSGKILVFG